MSAPPQSEPIGGGLVGWFASNPVTPNLLMAFLLLGGFFALTRMNAETFPEVNPGQITVSVLYRGATPDEVEDAITRRVEEAVIGIDGVDRVRSTAAEGSGTVTLELKDFVDAQLVKDDVETAVDQIADFPPGDAEEPNIVIAEADAGVMRLAVYGDLDDLALRAAAERVEADILRQPGVAQTTIQGARDREISIEVSETALRAYGLSLQNVADRVRAASVDLSGGTLRTSGGEILLRTDEERRSGEAFEDIVIASDESGRDLLLGDIANIVDGLEDVELLNTFREQPAVFIQISKGDDQDAFDVSGAVLNLLDTYAPPPGVSVEVVSDSTTVIADRLNLLVRNAIMGLALVFVFLAVTLDLRLAFWVCVGIFTAFLGAFLFISSTVTINMISLFGLIVTLGLVVDDAIVVGENIYEEQQRGSDGARAAVRGVMGVAAPVLVGVTTTIAAFAPLLFTTGTLGQILFPVPVVVISVLAASVIEAFLILPAHMAHAGEWSRGAMARVRAVGQGLLEGFRDRIVMPVVTLATRARYITAAVLLAYLLIAFSYVGSGAMRFVFFPQIEADEVSVTLEMPDGTAYAATERAMNQVVDAAYAAAGGRDGPNVDSLYVTIGGQLQSGGGPFGGEGTSVSSSIATATLVLTSPSERTLSSEEIAREWRALSGDIPGVRTLSFSASLVSGGDDVSVDLVHADDAKLEAAVAELAQRLSAIDGVQEIATGLDTGKRQIEFELTPAGAAAGLTTNDVARQVRQAFFGEEVQRIQRRREEVLVYVRYPADERRSLADLDRVRIRLADGAEAPLSVVARAIETTSPTTIDRVDGRRVLSVTADVDENVTTPNVVNAILTDEILPELTAGDPQLSATFEGQARQQQEDLSALAGNMGVALVIIYVLLASVLRSYMQPIVIMLAIPFAAASAIYGHIMMGYDLSFISLFGVVALSGVVINGSVVMLDHYNGLKHDDGQAAAHAIIAAVRRRFRPIILTTMTTFLGLVPILSETSLQAQILIPMAISLGFGILFTGFIILVLVPTLIIIGHDIRRLAGLEPAGERLANA